MILTNLLGYKFLVNCYYKIFSIFFFKKFLPLGGINCENVSVKYIAKLRATTASTTTWVLCTYKTSVSLL